MQPDLMWRKYRLNGWICRRMLQLRHITADATEDLKVGRFSYADAGQMHLYLNYAREHWVKPGENPPVGLILCAEKGAAEARYALDNLPNKILAAEYQTVLPDETLIAEELERTRAELEQRQTTDHPTSD
jgi:hypothetical protein